MNIRYPIYEGVYRILTDERCGNHGTAGETACPVGRLHLQGGQGVPDRAGAGGRRQRADAAGHRQMPALRRRDTCRKPGVQLLQLQQRIRTVFILHLEEHRRAPAYTRRGERAVRETDYGIRTGNVPGGRHRVP